MAMNPAHHAHLCPRTGALQHRIDHQDQIDHRARLTWLGHASLLLELGGTVVATDPALTSRLGHLRRHHAVDASSLPRPDVVLISHLHLDHLHAPSLRLLGPDLHVVVPAGGVGLLRRAGIGPVTEVRPGDTVDLPGVDIGVVRAEHSPRRGPHSRVSAPAVGYVVRSPQTSVYFPGDTDLFEEMDQLGPVDVAALPIWGWGPTLGHGHLDPVRAVRAAERVRSRLVVPVHWGTYSPIGVRQGPPRWLGLPAKAFAQRMHRAGLEESLRVLDPGGALDVVTGGASGVASDAG